MIRLFFAGDFCSTPSTAPITVSKELRALLDSCDFRCCNFEVPLLPDGATPIEEHFYQHDDAPAFLEGLGFNLFSFANNHAFDYGVEGWRKTVSAFHSGLFGAGKGEEAYRVKIVEKDGFKIGFLALCFAARYGALDSFAEADSYGCAWINDLRVNHLILEAKKEVDYLVILPHDGIEYIDAPLPETIARYSDFIDYGADLVIGTHPHCPQGWEMYRGKPIFYSLGNFLFNSKTDYAYRAWNRPHWYEGLCAVISLDETNPAQVSCELIHTRNEGNLELSIDHAAERAAHQEQVNRYLTEQQLLRDYLHDALRPVMLEQEFPILDGSFHRSTLCLAGKRWLWAFWKRLRGKKISVDGPTARLMRNDTRRNAVIRMMNDKVLD